MGPRDLGRHIAWDIGAAEVARGLSRLLDAPLFLSGCSRLLVDRNPRVFTRVGRGLGSPATKA